MFDTHAHVAFAQFDNDRQLVIERARQAGLTGWLEVGSSVGSSRQAVALAEKCQGVWATVGVHPDEIGLLQREDWQRLDELAGEEKVVAIGEIGLDYYRGGTYDSQIGAVEKFVALALKYNKPVVWHVRSSETKDANEDLLGFLTSQPAEKRPRGVAHTFSGTVEQAGRYIKLGLYLGISGVVTFKNVGALEDVVRMVPLEYLLVETDSPYLSPEPRRGQRNEPANVRYVVEKMAALKGVSAKEVEAVTDNNVRTLLKLSHQPKIT